MLDYVPPVYTDDEADAIVDKFMNRLYVNETSIVDAAAEMLNWAPAQIIMGIAIERFGTNGRNSFVNEGASQIERLAKARFPDVAKNPRTAPPNYNAEWGGEFGWTE
jgi:hypothetical protein